MQTMQAIPQPLSYVAAFEQLGFGMFIHWGLYSQLGRGEWAMSIHKIPKEEYRKLADTFTAEDFDARAIAKLAKRAGMKYIVLTTRHHDGFSLFDTRGLSDYDAVHSPAGRDLIAEFVEGCREEGIIPFFYHTILDWDQESFEGDFPAYLRYLQDSVEVLCTQYGKIGGLWFDGFWSKPDADWQEDVLYGIIRKHQPEAMITSNTGLHKLGDITHPEIDCVTFEQHRPIPLDRRGHDKYLASESNQTLGNFWGYSPTDFQYKSIKDLIEHLCTCRKAGANYLLNIGPTGTGKIVKIQEALLETMGDWLDIFGEAFYQSKPCGIQGAGNDFALIGEDGKLYFFIHDLAVAGDWNVTLVSGGVGPRTFAGVKASIRSMKWLDNGENLSFTQNKTADLFSFFATGQPYGTDYVVRVAVAEINEQ